MTNGRRVNPWSDKPSEWTAPDQPVV